MAGAPIRRQCKASLWVDCDSVAYLVTETPNEVAEKIEKALDEGRKLVQLTSGNESEWNGKPVFLRVKRIVSITPPMAQGPGAS